MGRAEVARLQALRRYAVLDTPPEPNFDRITLLTASVLDKPVCTLSLADADRHWFKSRFGVDATEMPRRMSFCDQTIRSDDVFVVPDAFADSRFVHAPIVAGPPHLRFYAGAPLITPAGIRIGSLCVLDTRPSGAFAEKQAMILSQLASTVVELLEARSRQIELADMTRSIAHLARHDPLTGLPNRRLLLEDVEHRMGHTPSEDHLAILFLDLDGFKAVNDVHGHMVGDKLLKQVAARLQWNVPAADSVARLGGDEFIILHRGSGQDVHATSADLASRIIGRVGEPYEIDGCWLKVGVSIGISVGPVHEASLERLLRAADAALYRVKSEGRGHFMFSEPVPYPQAPISAAA